MSTRAKAPYIHGIDEGNEHQKTGLYMASILAKGDHLWKFMTAGVMLQTPGQRGCHNYAGLFLL